VVNAGGKRGVCLWGLGTTRKRFFLIHKTSIRSLAFSPDSRILATGGEYGAVLLWDVATGKELRRSDARKEGVGSLTFSPDGKTLAVWRYFNGGLRLLAVDTLAEQKSLPAPDRYFTCLAFSPDGKRLVGAGQTVLCAWDIAAQKLLYRVPYRTGSQSVHCLAFSPDGKTLASSAGSTIRLWDVATGKQRGDRPGHEGEVSHLAVSPDGKVLASVATMQETVIRLWTTTGKPLHVLRGHKISVTRIAFSADSKYLVSGGDDSTALLWEVASGKLVRRFRPEGPPKGLERQVRDLALSTDGKRLAVGVLPHGSDSPPALRVEVWDVGAGTVLVSRTAPFDPLARFTPDGKGLLVSTRTGLVIQDTVTGTERTKFPENLRGWVAFSSDGKLLAVFGSWGGGEGVLRVLKTATGREYLCLRTEPFGPFAFSPEGRMLATADTEAVRVWELASGKERFRLGRHEALRGSFGPSFVSSLAFLPGGRALATGLVDGTILVWDLTPSRRSVK
jgi:WD40 repeat protein